MSTTEQQQAADQPAPAEDDEAKKLKAEERKKAKAAEKAAKEQKALEKKAKQEEIKQKELANKEKKEKEKAEKEAANKDVKKEEYVNTTPVGEKKKMSPEMAAAYDPIAVESAWYDWWEKEGYFKPEYGNHPANNEHFTIVIPPPNVTGSLHLGHALTNSVQDALVRWHRMLGHTTLWVPGSDHAGISTQVVVEKKLMRERKQTRHDLGRETFLTEVWKWKEQYEKNIFNQLKRIGSSVDWGRERFTMDEMLSKAVLEAFVRFYNDGLIYRATRLVNWCCILKTAISDVEVASLELTGITKIKVPGHSTEVEFGAMWEFAYKVEGSDDELVIATTRPETMLADTAIAIHPDDPRYKHLHGKKVVHPFHQTLLPIVLDNVLVDMNLGTGAVKVTPGHDPNDYECGIRHNLPMPELFTDDGRINENGGEFKGMLRFDARSAVIEKLKEKGLFKQQKANPMTISVCDRSKDIIEPRLKPQWWVKCSGLAAKAREAQISGELEILPATHVPKWHEWMTNIRDWCISRQLWWGHRIPAYIVNIKGQAKADPNNAESWIVAKNLEEATEVAVKRTNQPKENLELEQDPDVLDTWFSSALFPFSVMGWPDKTQDMENFYPTSLLETGQDILFFWVARMVFMGQHLTGKIPFKQVFLHAMVRDAHGKKMSKSLGNVIDPIDVITGISLEGLYNKLASGNLDASEFERAKAANKSDFPNGIGECGTDAMRFALCAYTAQGNNINLDIKRVEAYRAFCNKMWNATRFAMQKLGADFKPADEVGIPQGASKADQWILSRLSEAVKTMNTEMKAYNFNKATTACYNFWLYDLCDNYLEMTKSVFSNDGNAAAQEAARQTLFTCLEQGLLLIHPFMPFITEELYQRLPKRATDKASSVMVAAFPTTERFDQYRNLSVESEVVTIQEVIKAIRVILSTYNVAPSKKPKVYVNAKSEESMKLLPLFADVIRSLTYAGQVEVLRNASAPEGCAVGIATSDIDAFVDIKELIDVKAEIAKLEKNRTNLANLKDALQKKISHPKFTQALQSVQEESAQKLVKYENEIASLTSAIESFKKMSNQQ